MRKLTRYMPDIALWLIDNKFTQISGGAGQKIYQTVYDYEFYEDMYIVKIQVKEKCLFIFFINMIGIIRTTTTAISDSDYRNM